MSASQFMLGRHRAVGGRPRLSREDALVRVLVCIEHRDCVPVHLSEVCSAAGVSPRSLRTMFANAFGVPPSRYLRVRRLHQLHTALQMADPALRTVGEVCAALRITDAGRMAPEYHALFGEFPRHTLARRVGDIAHASWP